MLSLCRSLKIPALYVSGYLATEIASATHAWVEVFVPAWVAGAGPDAQSSTGRNLREDRRRPRLCRCCACSRTYKGTTERSMNVEVRIERRD